MLVAVSWCVVGLLALVALVRIVDWDQLWWPFVMLDAATIVLYLPAWPIALLAALLRRRALLLVALGLVACQVAFVLPELAASTPLPAWSAGAPTLRVFDANIEAGNAHSAAYAAEIRRDDPGLITLEEATPRQVVALRETGVLARYPHRFQVRWDNPFAFLVAARDPLVHPRVVMGNGEPLAVVATLVLPSGPVTLLTVHTVAPVPVSWHQWAGDLAILRRLVRRLGTRRLLVVGDFNATWGNRGFVRILSTGLIDGAAARGEDFQMTWSQTLGPLPPFVRIDHVLTGSGLAVRTIGLANGPGSDHLAVLATVAIRRR